MKRTTRLAALVLVVAAVGCGGINEKSKADVDRQLSAVTNSSETYPAPTDATTMPLAVGQWARYKGVDDEGRPSVTVNKVVGQSGEAWVVETVTESYYGRTVTQITMTITTDMKPGDIVKVMSKQDDGAPSEMTEMERKLAGDTFKKGLVAFAVEPAAGAAPQSITVPAGTFEAARPGQTTISLGPWSKTSQVWTHPAVPFAGVVKATGELGTTELLEFGTSGAEPEIALP